MRLTEHFTLEELRRSDTATRLGIDNSPSAEVIANASVSALGMEKVRSILGCAIFISSWFRCEALERILCAKDFAAWCVRHQVTQDEIAWAQYFRLKGHPRGWCIDFTAPQYGPPRQIVTTVKASGIKFDQMIVEGVTSSGGGWVHGSFDPRLRGEVLTATFKDGTPTYTNGVG